jgi:hypothetical protein
MRVFLAGVLSAVAMFLWSGIAHMALPLGQAGVQQIDKEEALFSTLRSTLSAPGFYLFPQMIAGTSQTEYQKKIATGPSGLLVYFPSRDVSFGRSLAVEFITELLQAFIAVYLLSLTWLNTFSGRISFYALLGLLAALATNISYWNWYGFPISYTSAYMFTSWIGYIFAGLVAAAMKIGGHNASASEFRAK